MAQQPAQTVQNNFTAGLKTEYTGLNFPENAATDTDNCTYTLTGDVTRRLGINFEKNGQAFPKDLADRAITSYKWNNAGGDGNTQIVVVQIGAILNFYVSSNSTVNNPLSTQVLSASIDLATFQPYGSTINGQLSECQFTDGNGYLFVFHPSIEPFYCTYDVSDGSIVGSLITLQTRDFKGAYEPGIDINFRSNVLTAVHHYNLENQGWTSGSSIQTTTADSLLIQTGILTCTIPSGLTGYSNGTRVTFFNQNGFVAVGSGNYIPPYLGAGLMAGTITGYTGTTLTVNINIVGGAPGSTTAGWLIQASGAGYIDTWNSSIGNYPSNSDVWWRYKNSSGSFDPATTFDDITSNNGAAPKGHFILNEFAQNISAVSGVAGLDVASTYLRPKTGCWFQGRVWFAGVDDFQKVTTTLNNYSWTENIYFSQVAVSPDNFARCYQVNDPTNEDLFDLLPTDGGVIQIQGCGSVYKLFPIQNGLLVFAANGVWFITGSTGIGFAADDYTITKISNVRSISGTSYVNVQGLPVFWNEEDIYQVNSGKSSLTVDPLCVGTILSFYEDIPLKSKLSVRGDYDPINYTIQWVFRETEESNLTTRYQFNRILNYNTYNKAFFPYTIQEYAVNNRDPHINGIIYVANPGDGDNPPASFKYLSSSPNEAQYGFTFSDETDETYHDWATVDGVGADYDSYFITGYNIRGQGIRKFQPQYIQVYSETEGAPFGYKIQGIWDYSNNRNSNRWSSIQTVLVGTDYYDVISKRHKIRGHGYALQLKLKSLSGMPFNIIGWVVLDMTNAGT